MTAWTTDELDRVATAHELEIAVARPDGTLRDPVPIWVVRHGDDLYVRSWRGAGGRWYRAARSSHAARIRAGGVEQDVALVEPGDDVDDAVDAAYRAKYGGSTYAEAMIAPAARATTLRLVPA